MDLVAPLLCLALLTFCSGYFSASESALFSLSPHKLKIYQNDPQPRKKLIAQLLSQPRDLLVTVFMLNTFVNILLQNVASHLFGETASWALKVGVPLGLTLILGEIIPKYIGLQNNTAIAFHVVPIINFLQNLLTPVRRWVIAVTAPVSRFLFFFLRKDASISKKEMEHVLKTSKEHGVLSAEEAELVSGYLNLQDSSVKELMRPREDILFYNSEEPLSKLEHLFVDLKCSRLPVCKGALENIVGVISAKKYFLIAHEVDNQEKLIKLLDKPYYVPENTIARILLHRFDEEEHELAIVVDEYGSISGLITREDLLEVVIGEIADSRDDTKLFTSASEKEIIASGKFELESFNNFFKSNLISDSNRVTIGGWLTEKLGEIPKSGAKVKLEGFLFHILSAEPNKIRRLYIRKL